MTYSKFERMGITAVWVLSLAVAGTVLLLFASEASFDRRVGQTNAETFALLAGFAGYLVAQAAGARRATAVEVGFISSAAAAVAASATQHLAGHVRATLLIAAAFVAIAYIVRSFAALVEKKSGPSAATVTTPPPPKQLPATPSEIRALLEANEARVLRDRARRTFAVAVVGGIVVALLSRIGRTR